MILQLDGVVLRTAHLDKMVEFYSKVLGLGLVKKTEGGAFLSVPNGGGIVFEAEDGEAAGGGSRAFLTFRVENADGAYKTLAARGVKLSARPKADELGVGVTLFSTMDPDGNLVGFVQRG